MGGSPGGGAATATPGAAAVGRRRAALTTALMNLASIVERADEGILPAVYVFIGKSLGVGLWQLGALTLCRALVQALSSPLSGILGDRYDRAYIVAAGCLVWGVMTAAIGLSRSLGQAMVSCAVNGLGLALVIPCVSSMVADYHPPETRGGAFGMMGFTASLGGMAGAFYATNVGATTLFGIEGWRFAFHLVGGVCLFTAALVLRFAVDPRHLHHHPSLHGQQAYRAAAAGSGPTAGRPGAGSPSGGAATGADLEQAGAAAAGGVRGAPLLVRRQVWRDIKSVLRIRSFQIIVLQASGWPASLTTALRLASCAGIVGSVPWQAMVWFTAFFQLLGFTDLQSASLMATFSCGCALGGLLGGTLGDRMARKLPNSPNGRILTNQLSVLIGLPLSCLVLKGLPVGVDMGRFSSLYGCVLFVFGLWCGCNNSALFAELVPEEQRSTIYAFDRSFEGAVGAMGAPLVGLAAERLFGFRGALGDSSSGADGKNVAALSSALLVCMVVPWVLCLLFFTALHWTFKEDRRKSVRRGGKEEVVETRALIETAAVRKRADPVSRAGPE
ncbi:hypothetical protein CHLNCDRAFT_140406 [Chlorella variabilis]|uniref:Major facilitator superfamily (MFS) profile domain-containing protein n=1 Tax=Chlorella variabilis TaxID=554065 RepID=E1Z6Y8_CHLVA|nr:hypothetical protein CHLNCDRAFT_140406 [Chlorella variabilis]EFN58437.1 hypothetical protein CHLNCDRAFT_140406 [Chlorella variabilis]|eukprot:XP_005850539.1 hypothetical protein CHLNCDRAFT_140406 [Chlorella variabilis]